MRVVLTQFLLSLSVVRAQMGSQVDIQQIQENIINHIPSIESMTPGIMDPSTFTKEVVQCQQNCGDGYYKCFLSCEDTTHITHPTQVFLEAQPKYQQKWSGYLLKLLTFGYFGDDNNDDENKFFFEAHYIGDENGMSDNKCLKNCTKLFRTCFRHCACKVKEDEIKCMSKLVVSNKLAERDSGTVFTAKFDYATQKGRGDDRQASEYQFDWGRLS